MSDQTITLKIKGLPQLNERDYAEHAYQTAMIKMIMQPTKENVDAFTKANAHLFEVYDAYRIGTKLLITFHALRARPSQKLQLL